MQLHRIEQYSPEWWDLRNGHQTASNFPAIMANAFDKDGAFVPGRAFGKEADKYAQRLAIERVTGQTPEAFSNLWTDRGTELEPIAIAAYEDRFFCTVEPGGFAEHGMLGASIDGFVDDGGIEVKCVKYTTHFDRIRKGGYNTAYRWQIVGEMWLCDLPWIDYVSFCPEFPLELQLYTHKVERNNEAIEMVEERTALFEPLIEKYTDMIETTQQ